MKYLMLAVVSLVSQTLFSQLPVAYADEVESNRIRLRIGLGGSFVKASEFNRDLDRYRNSIILSGNVVTKDGKSISSISGANGSLGYQLTRSLELSFYLGQFSTATSISDKTSDNKETFDLSFKIRADDLGFMAPISVLDSPDVRIWLAPALGITQTTVLAESEANYDGYTDYLDRKIMGTTISAKALVGMDYYIGEYFGLFGVGGYAYRPAPKLSITEVKTNLSEYGKSAEKLKIDLSGPEVLVGLSFRF